MDWLKSICFWWNLKYNVTSKLYCSRWLTEAPSAHKYLCHVWTRRDLDSYGFKPWNWVGIKLYHGAVISHTVSKLGAMFLFEDRFSNPSKSHTQWCHLEHWRGSFSLRLSHLKSRVGSPTFWMHPRKRRLFKQEQQGRRKEADWAE